MSDLEPLSTEEIENKISDLPDGWKYIDNKLVKTFEFEGMLDGVNLLAKLVPYCNKIDHHPDVMINFKKFRFELTRWDVGQKVTARDFLVAKKIEELYKER